MNSFFQLFLKAKKNQLSTAEQEEYQRVVQQMDEEEVRAYDRIWEMTGQYKAHAHQFEALRAHQDFQKRIKTAQKPVRRLHPYRLVASIFAVLLLTALLGYFLRQSRFDQLIVQDNPSDVERVHRLPDGTLVRMQPNSLLQYHKAMTRKKQREVELSGSAFFAVSRMPEKPFVVGQGETEILVLGTRFMVSQQTRGAQSAIVVEVEEGKVAFWESTQADTLILAKADRGICIPGQTMHQEKFDLHRGSLPVHEVKSRGWTLKKVGEEFFHWSNAKLILSESVGACTISGDLDVSSPYRLKENLQALGFEVRLTKSGDLMVAAKEGCP